MTGETPLRFDLEKYGYLGYQQFSKKANKPFLVKIYGLDHYVLPVKYLDSLKTVDHHRLSFAQSLNDFLNVDASLGDLVTHSDMEIAVVTKHLNPRLTTLTPVLVDEANFAFEKELGKLETWKTVNALFLSAFLTNRTSGRVLVGDLCRDDNYLHAMMKYTESVFSSGVAFNGIPLGPFRKIVYYLGARQHRRDLDNAAALVLPEIKRRMAAQAEDPNCRKENDAIQWNLDLPLASPKEGLPLRHAHRVLHLSFAATGTVAILITHMIYNVLMYPEYLEPLREEVMACTKAHGGWTEKAMNEMWKLDSFIRETLRVQPPSVFTAYRTVKNQPFTFPDGFTLPVGSRITFPTLPVGLDPENYESASEFDGFRFFRKREEARLAKKAYNWGATKIDSSFLPFGYGNQACPGRFFGVRKTKILFGKLINDYDFSWAEPRSARPENIVIEGQILVNPTPEIKIKSRVAAGM